MRSPWKQAQTRCRELDAEYSPLPGAAVGTRYPAPAEQVARGLRGPVLRAYEEAVGVIHQVGALCPGQRRLASNPRASACSHINCSPEPARRQVKKATTSNPSPTPDHWHDPNPSRSLHLDVFWNPHPPHSAARSSLLPLRARRVDFFALCEALPWVRGGSIFSRAQCLAFAEQSQALQL